MWRSGGLDPTPMAVALVEEGECVAVVLAMTGALEVKEEVTIQRTAVAAASRLAGEVL
jgi:hypothetical protein